MDQAENLQTPVITKSRPRARRLVPIKVLNLNWETEMQCAQLNRQY